MTQPPVYADAAKKSPDRLAKIKKVSRVFKYFFGLWLVIWAGFAVATWIVPIHDNRITVGFGDHYAAAKSKAENPTDFSETRTLSIRIGAETEKEQNGNKEERLRPGFEWCLRAIMFTRVLFQMLGLWIVYRLFRCFEQGIIFETSAVQWIRWTGWWLIGSCAEDNFFEWTDLLTMNPAFADFHIDGGVGIGLLVLLISWIMEEGCRLKQEQELTI